MMRICNSDGEFYIRVDYDPLLRALPLGACTQSNFRGTNTKSERAVPYLPTAQKFSGRDEVVTQPSRD